VKSKNKNKQVAQKIIDILRNGLMINADTQHYIDSTFSNPSVGELEELLQDESSCETDSLMELLFFPDESVQKQLEEMIEDTHFQRRDEREIQNRVCSTSLQTQIRFPDGRGAWIRNSGRPSPGMFMRGFKPDLKSDSATPNPSLHQIKFHSCRRFLKNCKLTTMNFLIISILH
jgi:hypothetical protein